MCERVSQFQVRLLHEELDAEAVELIGSEAQLAPSFVIAPYFFLGGPEYAAWLKINAECYKVTRELVGEIPCFMQVVLAKQLLESPDPVLRAIEDSLPTGVVLWVDDHAEEALDLDGVKRYLKLSCAASTHARTRSLPLTGVTFRSCAATRRPGRY